KPVYFAYDSAVIRNEEVAKLKMLAGFLESNPNLFLIIEGHCDERGSEEYNRALSERRALAIKAFVEKNASSVSPRINTIGYGEEKLADTALTNLAHAKNRRGEFIIISKR
ncbi:MAG: OmpA family protein, partial [Lentisphaeraceae bacterium]|nr:OmpA family protein [Lentisphaeraceae bacterium]